MVVEVGNDRVVVEINTSPPPLTLQDAIKNQDQVVFKRFEYVALRTVVNRIPGLAPHDRHRVLIELGKDNLDYFVPCPQLDTQAFLASVAKVLTILLNNPE